MRTIRKTGAAMKRNALWPKWPVGDTRRADYLLGNDNNRFGIYEALVDVVEPCAWLAGAFPERR